MYQRIAHLARTLRAAPVALVAVLAIAACGGGDDTDDTDDAEAVVAAAPAESPAEQSTVSTSLPVSSGHTEWYRPQVGDTWQWQLSGEVDSSYEVDVYDVDLFDVPASKIAALQADGRRVICYFSAGSSEDWRDDFGEFAGAVQGEPLDGWEGERWLDIRDDGVLDVMLRRLDVAQRKGCDGVEPDNVQSYGSDTGFGLTQADQLAYNVALADAAHERGLAIGLKNGAEMISQLIEHFDFSVNEECHDYDECEPYEAFVAAGKPVFNAEYAARYVDDADARAELCVASGAAGFSTLVLPLELDGTFRHSC